MGITAAKLKGLLGENEIICACIAAELGLDPSTVSKVTTGNGRSAKVESAIAKRLNMDPDDIFPVIRKVDIAT